MTSASKELRFTLAWDQLCGAPSTGLPATFSPVGEKGHVGEVRAVLAGEVGNRPYRVRCVSVGD